jgi:hypothetical protein
MSKIFEVREVGKFERLKRCEIIGGFGRSVGLEVLGGRKDRQDPLASNACVFATSRILCKL